MSRFVVLVALLTFAAVAPGAYASDTLLSPAPGDTGITAYAGQVILSHHDPVTNQWALVRWHNGIVDALPIPERSVPFDADAGPDADGNPVVVYSRCAVEPAAQVGLAPSVDWETARGCNIFELSLTGTPRQTQLAVPSSTSTSETTPSVYKGALAFVSHRSFQAVPSIEYLAPGATKLKRLAGGSVQLCDQMCGFAGSHDEVNQLDLGPSRIAYVWQMSGGELDGIGPSWELRSAPRNGDASTLLRTGGVSGACGYALPSAPTSDASPLSFLDAGAECDVTETHFATADPKTGILARAPTPGGLAAGLTRDGSTLYWLRFTGSPQDAPVPGNGTCGDAGAACQLMASTLPTYVPQPIQPMFPPSNVDLETLGYHWVHGPGGVRLLRPPTHVACAPSAAPAYVDASARWTTGKHTVTVYRTDSRGTMRLGFPLKRSLPDGEVAAQSPLAHCGSHFRMTYVVKTGGSSGRVSFNVSRRGAP